MMLSLLGEILKFSPNILLFGEGQIFPEITAEMFKCIYRKDRRSDCEYWDSQKLDALSTETLERFLWALKRVEWICDKVNSQDVVNYMCKDVGCEPYHMYRMGPLSIYYHIKKRLEHQCNLFVLKKLPVHTEIPDSLLEYDFTEDFKVKFLDPIKKVEEYDKMISNLGDEQPSQQEIFKKLMEDNNK